MSAPRVKYVPQEQRKGDSHQLPRGLRREIVERDGGRCQVCWKKGTHVSHRIPISRGGETLDWNLALYCEKCWKAKDDLLPEEFIKSPYVKELFAPDLLGDNPVNVLMVFTDGTHLAGKMRSHPYERQAGDWLIVREGVEMLIPREQVKGIAILRETKQIKDIQSYLKRISS